MRRARALGVVTAAAIPWTPGVASACSWCISSAFGDRSFNWPYLSLILAPFLVGVVIAIVLSRSAGVGLRTLVAYALGRAPARDESEPIKETT